MACKTTIKPTRWIISKEQTACTGNVVFSIV